MFIDQKRLFFLTFYSLMDITGINCILKYHKIEKIKR